MPLWCWPMNPEPAISLQEKLIAEAVAGSLVVPEVWLGGGQQPLKGVRGQQGLGSVLSLGFLYHCPVCQV